MPRVRGTSGSGSGAVDWNGVTGKPATFPPDPHAHDWASVTGKPSTFPADPHSHSYGSLTGTPDLSELPTPGQKNALSGTQGTPGATNQYVTTQDPRNTDARQALAHTHPWGDLTAVPASFPPATHTHPQSEVTNLVSTLAGKAATAHTHLVADTTGLQAALDAKAAAAHTHPQGDVTGLTAVLSGKSDTGHTHAQADVTGLVAVLAAKQDAATAASWTAVVRQAADLSNSTVTFANTDLVFTFVANGVYAVDLYLLAQAAATTTGFGFAFDTSVATTVAALGFTHVLANTGTVTAGHSRADAAATGVSSGVDTVNAVVPIIGSGLVVAAATGGTARLVFRPEVAAAATFKANSVMRVHKIA